MDKDFKKSCNFNKKREFRSQFINPSYEFKFIKIIEFGCEGGK